MHQIKPYFLFNSMNVLSMLVYKNPRDADRFIQEFSKMYRYILRLNEAHLSISITTLNVRRHINLGPKQVVLPSRSSLRN